MVIADNFSNYFKKIYTWNDQTRADKLKADFYKLYEMVTVAYPYLVIWILTRN